MIPKSRRVDYPYFTMYSHKNRRFPLRSSREAKEAEEKALAEQKAKVEVEAEAKAKIEEEARLKAEQEAATKKSKR
ncbi:hypothetical protein ACIQZG_21670 [Lysinibacillus sp. NPDC096418]|uniref:hypothetical protein n=1 Tax=Lysinibacillus sp. NPDC096418 TaxID=3364138 RepID=UPI00381DA32B